MQDLYEILTSKPASSSILEQKKKALIVYAWFGAVLDIVLGSNQLQKTPYLYILQKTKQNTIT